MALLCSGLSLAGCGTVASEVAVPEPMVFDLVRGLGAEAGELEANVLATAPLRSGDPSAPEVAPEIEYAVADGLALEFELPFEDDGLYSIKTAFQATLGDDAEAGFVHGVQGIAERLIDDDGWDLALLWIPAWRFDDERSLLGMVGAGAFVGSGVEDELGLLANVTVFQELDERWTLGFEVDSESFDSLGDSVLLMPQLHWEPESEAGLSLQFGVGAVWIDGSVVAGDEQLIPEAEGWFPQVTVRGILEF